MKAPSLGQLLLVGVRGAEIDAEEEKLLRRVQPGAFILFGRNIKTPTQLRNLTDSLREIAEIEPIITIDQEGGRVSRLRLIGNEPPNAQQLREKGDLELIREHGNITGCLLRLFGFNLDLCPVLDISFDDEADNSLRGRCYGNSSEEVIRNATVFNEALRETGVASCGKHFPGYSAATIDAHYELPCIDRSRAQLDQAELAVFKAFASSLDSMMICHGWYPAFEAHKTPASLSSRVVSDLLRNEFGFEGLVMTDDLDMGAILYHYSLDETLRLTFAAGNDIAMICHRIDKIGEALQALKALPRQQTDRALENVAQFKSKMAPPTPFSEARFREVDQRIWTLRVAVLGEERAHQRSTDKGSHSPVELY